MKRKRKKNPEIFWKNRNRKKESYFFTPNKKDGTFLPLFHNV